MKIKKKIFRNIHAIAIAALPLTCYAQSEKQNSGFIIVGPAASPEYMGSDHYGVVPMIVSEFWLGSVDVEVEGLTTRAGLYKHHAWTFGLTAEFDFGRDEDIDNAIVASMTKIDPAVNAGLYAAYERDNFLQNDDSLEFRISGFADGGNTHEGAYTTLGLVYTLPMVIPWRFQFELETTYANRNYMNTYFGINHRDSTLSGLATYEAGSSLRDITFSTNIGLFFNPTYGVFMRLSAAKLLGDATDSPITNAGSSEQYFAGLAAYYRF